MNLDELANRLRVNFVDPAVQRLGAALLEWKTDSSTVVELRERIERYIGNSCIATEEEIATEEDHRAVYGLWSSFRDDAINRIGGMTMNERLYWFGLVDRFDGSNEQEQLVIYRKLNATPYRSTILLK